MCKILGIESRPGCGSTSKWKVGSGSGSAPEKTMLIHNTADKRINSCYCFFNSCRFLQFFNSCKRNLTSLPNNVNFHFTIIDLSESTFWRQHGSMRDYYSIIYMQHNIMASFLCYLPGGMIRHIQLPHLLGQFS
jgi:hypothetical protein